MTAVDCDCSQGRLVRHYYRFRLDRLPGIDCLVIEQSFFVGYDCFVIRKLGVSQIKTGGCAQSGLILNWP